MVCWTAWKGSTAESQVNAAELERLGLLVQQSMVLKAGLAVRCDRCRPVTAINALYAYMNRLR